MIYGHTPHDLLCRPGDIDLTAICYVFCVRSKTHPNNMRRLHICEQKVNLHKDIRRYEISKNGRYNSASNAQNHPENLEPKKEQSSVDMS